MNKQQKENCSKISRWEKQIVFFYHFNKYEDKLVYEFSNTEKLVFCLFPKVGVMDLFKSTINNGTWENEKIILGFSLENREHLKVLSDLFKLRKQLTVE